MLCLHGRSRDSFARNSREPRSSLHITHPWQVSHLPLCSTGRLMVTVSPPVPKEKLLGCDLLVQGCWNSLGSPGWDSVRRAEDRVWLRMAAHRDQDWHKHLAGPVTMNTPGLPGRGGKTQQKGKAESGDVQLCWNSFIKYPIEFHMITW